jgi:hypothetical protein
MTRMERRGFIVGTLGLLAAPLAVEAQQVGKVYRIGFLRAGEPLIDAQGRRRPPLACWTCGREVAPMRFRADDLRRQGWASQQTPSRSRMGAAAPRSTCPSPPVTAGGSSCRSGSRIRP